MGEHHQWAIDRVQRLVVACFQAREVGQGVEEPWVAAELGKVIDELAKGPAANVGAVVEAFTVLSAALMSDVEDLGGPPAEDLLLRHLAQIRDSYRSDTS
jgi:hypothetical protein